MNSEVDVTSDEQAVKAEMNIGWRPIETTSRNDRIMLVGCELVSSGSYRYPPIYDTKKE